MAADKASASDRFALVSGAIIAAAGAVLGVLYYQSVSIDLKSIAERNNIALTHAFANLVWPRIDGLVENAHTLSIEELKAHPEIAETRAAVIAVTRNVPVVKIKIYDLSGLTVFSSDPSQIGQDKSGNAGFLAARRGQVASELSHRDSFSAFEREISNRDLLSSYVPIRGANAQISGIFEIYYDVTAFIAQLRRTALLQIGVISLTFLLLYLVVRKLMRKRDRLIERHHAEQLRLTRKAVVAEEASRAKSDFLANMSHELRTPLNAILGFTETMRLEKFGPIGTPRYTTYLDDILMSGRHLLCIIDDVLDMSRVESGKMRLELEQVPLGEIIDDCLRIIENTKDGEASIVSKRIDDPSISLFVDGRRMKQVLLNILTNAKACTPPTGRIEITAGRSSAGGLELTVSDTGIGMDPESLETALTPFGHIGKTYTRPTNGTGLGLPLARSLVDMHGGGLTITSRLGQGTRVTIDLPRNCIADLTVPRLRVGAA